MKTTYKFVDLAGDPIKMAKGFPPPNIVIPCDIVSAELRTGLGLDEMVITLMYRHDLPTTPVGRLRTMKRFEERVCMDPACMDDTPHPPHGGR